MSVLFGRMYYSFKRALLHNFRLFHPQKFTYLYRSFSLRMLNTDLDRPLGLREFEATRIWTKSTQVASLSGLRTGRVDPRDTVRSEGLSQWKMPMTPSEIEPATVQRVVQCLNKIHHRVSSLGLLVIGNCVYLSFHLRN